MTPNLRDINTAIKVLKDVQSKLMRDHWNDLRIHEDPEVISLYEARLTLERLEHAGGEK